tara:strand:+ start:786 stop:1322 length:537 start_codon:yes stop_codon:yes gene_type:complete
MGSRLRFTTLITAALCALGCDPGQTPATPPTPPQASAPANPNPSAAAVGVDLTGLYDYSQVVSLDDPDGAPRVLTFAVTTERKLKGVAASLVSEGGATPLSGLGIDFKTQSLVVVVRPGGGPPPEIVSVERGEKSAVVKFRVPAGAGSPSKSGQGRYTARVVSPPIPGSATFQDLSER